MLITIAEYKYLFGDSPKEEITNDEIMRQWTFCEKARSIAEPTSAFRTYQEVGIIYDEYGTARPSIIEKTGFEMEN